MGTSTRLADALFSSVQQRVLALLFGHPERSFSTGELIRLAKGGTGGVHRLLRRLAGAGWVTVTPIGNQKHYRANRACPAFHDLHGLVSKTLGAPRTGRRAEKSRRGSGAVTRRPSPPPLPEEPKEKAAAPALGATQDDGWKSW